MLRRETYWRTLESALGIVGSEVALATRLSVPPYRLSRWLSGDPIPHAVFLDAVDIVVGAQARPA